MKLRQLFENFVISNDEFEDYLNRTTEQLTTEIQSGKNARDAIHELSVQFSKMHNSAYAAYQRMSDALTARMYVLELDAQPDMGMGGDEFGMGDELGDDDFGPEMGGDEFGMGDELGGDVEQLNDPMGAGMQMDLPMGDEMPSDNEMDDYNAVMSNTGEEPNAFGESRVSEAGKMKGGAKDPCWNGYKMVGTKKKGSKEVPNCVPESANLKEGNTRHRISRLKMMIDDRRKQAKMAKDPIKKAHHLKMADQYEETLNSFLSQHEELNEFLPALRAAGSLAGKLASGTINQTYKATKTGADWVNKQIGNDQGIQSRFGSGSRKESVEEETYEDDMWFNEDEQLDKNKSYIQESLIGKVAGLVGSYYGVQIGLPDVVMQTMDLPYGTYELVQHLLGAGAGYMAGSAAGDAADAAVNGAKKWIAKMVWAGIKKAIRSIKRGTPKEQAWKNYEDELKHQYNKIKAERKMANKTAKQERKMNQNAKWYL